MCSIVGVSSDWKSVGGYGEHVVDKASASPPHNPRESECCVMGEVDWGSESSRRETRSFHASGFRGRPEQILSKDQVCVYLYINTWFDWVGCYEAAAPHWASSSPSSSTSFTLSWCTLNPTNQPTNERAHNVFGREMLFNILLMESSCASSPGMGRRVLVAIEWFRTTEICGWFDCACPLVY